MNAKQLLDNTKFLAETLESVGFGIHSLPGHAAWAVNKIPSVSEWNGEVHLFYIGKNGPQVIKVLKEFGIDADLDENKGVVIFNAGPNHDIVAVMADVIERQKVRKKLHYLAGLEQNVDQLIQQMPHVKHGMFSRGVNAMKHQVGVLNNVRKQNVH